MSYILPDALYLDLENFSRLCSLPTSAQPALSLALKTEWTNYTGVVEPLMLYAQSSWKDGQLPAPDTWQPFKLNTLQAIAKNSNLGSDQIQDALCSCLVQPADKWISPDTFVHAIATSAYTCLVQPLSILTFFMMEDSEVIIRQTLGEDIKILPLNTPVSLIGSVPEEGLVLMNHGLLVCGDSLNACQNNLKTLFKKLEEALPAASTSQNVGKEISTNLWRMLPALRKTLSTKMQHPLILNSNQSVEAIALANSEQTWKILCTQNPLPVFAARANPLPLECDPNKQGTCFVTVQPGLGVIATGTSTQEAQYTADVFQTLIKAALAAHQSGAIKSLAPKILAESSPTWFPESITQVPFSGEISLVTGAASGIGRACAESLLQRGAVVIGLDINPDIANTFDHPGFMGLECDISNEEAVREGLQTVVKTFGGLDMMVLSAGLFPEGCHIKDITLKEFNKVHAVNLTGNLILMREAYPLLKHAARYGRVVIVGSKNTKAPGPGAVAYSTSKAAVTQMARVAAMEWAPDGIRVNVIHPDAVFDTALYTQAVLKARADYYGMTIEEYKKRNLLKTEITSYIIGEMVSEMCGTIFMATTGAQVQVDGGNDRTI